MIRYSLLALSFILFSCLFVGAQSTGLKVDAGRDTVVCPYSYVYLHATCNDDSVTYSWSPAYAMDDSESPNPAVVIYTNTTTFTVTVTDQSGNTAQDEVVVYVDDFLVNAIAYPGREFCRDGSGYLYLYANACNAASYSWSPADGLSNPTSYWTQANPSKTTTYTITITDNYGNKAWDTVTVTPVDFAVYTDAYPSKMCKGEETYLYGQACGDVVNYSWTPTTGVSDPSSPYTTATPSVTTTYTLTVTDSKGNKKSDAVTVEVNALNVSAAVYTYTNTDTICKGDYAYLYAWGCNNVSYSWSPSNDLNNPNSSNPVARPSKTTTYTVTVTGPDGSKDSAHVTVYVVPIFVIVYPNISQEICEGESIQLYASACNGFSYSWSPAEGLDNPNSAYPVASPTKTTTYTATVTDQNGNTAQDQITITVNKVSVDAGYPQTVCKGESIQLHAEACNADSYSWSPATGLSDPNSSDPIATPSETITYTVTVKDKDGNEAVSSVNVYVEAIGMWMRPDTIICSGEPVKLYTTHTCNAKIYEWSPASSLDDPTSPAPIARPEETTIYTLTISDGQGNTASESVTVYINNIKLTAGPDSSKICAGAKINLYTTGCGGLTYSWSPTDGLDDPTSPNPKASPTKTTTYTVTATDAKGNKERAAVTVIIDGGKVNAGRDTTICRGQSVQLHGEGCNPLWFSWSPTGSLDYPYSQDPIATPTQTTVYTLQVQNGNGKISYDQVRVTVNQIEVHAGKDTTICLGDSIELKTTSCNADAFVWMPLLGVSDPISSHPYAKPTQTTTYTVRAANADGNIAIDDITVKVMDVGVKTIEDTIICFGSSIELVTTACNADTFSWSPIEGLSDPASPAPIAYPTENTVYTVTVTDKNGKQAIDKVLVEVVRTLADAGEDVTICKGDAVKLTGRGCRAVIYRWEPAEGLSDSTVFNPVASPENTTTYTLYVKDINGNEDIDQVTVKVLDVSVETGADTTICAGDSIQLFAAGCNIKSYSWTPAEGLSDPTSANPFAAPSETITYTVTVSDKFGNQAVADLTVYVDNVSLFAYPADTTICAGSSVNLHAEGCHLTSFFWTPAEGLSDPSSSDPVATPSQTTAYTVTGTDKNGNKVVDHVTINVLNISSEAGNDTTICAGESVQLRGWGCNAVSYQWSPAKGLSDATIANPVARPAKTTTYSLTVTDKQGSQALDALTITVMGIFVNAGNDTTVCSGQRVQLSTFGCNVMSYSWSPAEGLDNPNSANPVARPKQTTTYQVLVTDSSGNQALDDVTIYITPLSVETDADTAICVGDVIQLHSTACGDVSYSWSPAKWLNNPDIPDPIVKPESTITYTVTVTDSFGNTISDQVTITVADLLLQLTPDTTICKGNSIQLEAEACNAVSYKWLPATGLNKTDVPDPIASPVETTSYTLTATDSKGNEVKGFVTITVKAVDVELGNDTSVCKGASVQLLARGCNVDTYQWSPSAGLNKTDIANPVASPAKTTTYQVTVTDVNGNQSIDELTITVTNADADAGPDTTICSGSSVQLFAKGCDAVSYEWSPAAGLNNPAIANPIANPQATTTYTVKITNLNGNEAVDEVTVTVLKLNVEATGDATICKGSAIQLFAEGCNITGYEWSPATGLNNPYIANPIASPDTTIVYSVLVKDANGNEALDAVMVTVLDVSANAGRDTTICAGQSVRLSASGCNIKTYLWSPSKGLDDSSSAQPVARPLETTTYQLIVTDTAGNQSLDEVTIYVKPFSVETNADTSVCAGDAVQLYAEACNAVSYLWSPADGLSNPQIQNPLATPQITTTYTVTATDSTGAKVSAQVILTVADIVLEVSNDTAVCKGTAVQLNAAACNAISYEWSPAIGLNNATIANPIAAPETTTTYTVTVKDANGKETNGYVTLTIMEVSVDVGNDTAICTGGSVQLQAEGCNAVKYEWSPAAGLNNPAIPNPIATPLETTTYRVTVTDANGNQSLDELTITVMNGSADAGRDTTICAGNSVQLLAVGCHAVKFEWSPETSLNNANTANPIATPQATTTYTVKITDLNGNETIDNVTVNVLDLTVEATGDTAVCKGLAAQLLAVGCNIASYSWSPAAGLNNPSIPDPIASPDSSTLYTVVAADKFGNKVSDQVLVTVNDISTEAWPDTTICAGESVQLFSQSCNAESYSWSPVEGLSDPSVPNPVASPGQTTTYVLTITDKNGQKVSEALTITVRPVEVKTITDTTICSGMSVQLEAWACNAVSYQWSPATGLNNPYIPNPIASPSQTTTYSVRVANANGDTAIADVLIEVDPLSVDAGEDWSICLGDKVQLSASGCNIVSYQWSPSAGLNEADIPNPIAGPAATTEYVVTVKDAGGNESTDTVVIEVTDIDVDAGPDVTICSGLSVQLEASGCNVKTYQWSPATGLNNPAIPNPIATPADTTVYVVKVTDQKNNETTDTVVVNVTPLGVFAGNDTAICLGSSVQLSATTCNAASYSWSPAAGLSNPGSARPFATPATTTVYTVTIADGLGNNAIDSIKITVESIAQADAGRDTMVCSGTPVQLSATGGVQYHWEPAEGLSDANSPSPTTIPLLTTTYYVTVTNSCNLTATDSVVVNVGKASLSTEVQCLSTGKEVVFAWSRLPQADYYEVSFDGVNWHLASAGLTSLDTVYVFKNAIAGKKYELMVRPVGGQYCGAGPESEMEACYLSSSENFYFYMPTAFSPNDDRENDILQVTTGGIQEYTFVIFNRWGDEVFRTIDLNKGWDGMHARNNVPCTSGIYMYAVRAVDKNKTKHDFRGVVALVR